MVAPLTPLLKPLWSRILECVSKRRFVLLVSILIYCFVVLAVTVRTSIAASFKNCSYCNLFLLFDDEAVVENAANQPDDTSIGIKSSMGMKETQQSFENDYPNLYRLNQTILSAVPTTNPWEQELFARLDRIRNRCGELCAINDLAGLEKYTVDPWMKEAVSMRQLKVPVDCDTLMLDKEIDESDYSIPAHPPEALKPFYTMNYLFKYEKGKSVNQTYLNTDSAVPVWTSDLIQELYGKCKKFLHKSISIATYGMQSNDFVRRLEKYVPMKGKRVMVIGTEHPWLEAACLYLGARHVVTLEYGKIVSKDPRISTYTPEEFRELYRTGKLEPFDAVVSFSSLEHPGLGRYGDALNPWGDVLSIAKAWCVTKPGGHLGLSVPSRRGDKLIFNLYRSYGMYRYPLLTANWQQIDGKEHRGNDPPRRHIPYVFQKP